jgi:hypothetical protein
MTRLVEKVDFRARMSQSRQPWPKLMAWGCRKGARRILWTSEIVVVECRALLKRSTWLSLVRFVLPYACFLNAPSGRIFKTHLEAMPLFPTLA